jgi:DNA polymerase I
MRGLKSDTMAKAAIFNVSQELGLKELYASHFGVETSDFRETFVLGRIKKNGEVGKTMYLPQLDEVVSGSLDFRWKGGGIRRLVEYAVRDPKYTVDLDEYLDKQIRNMEWYRDKSMLDYYEMLDNPFLEALYKVERRGLLLNQVYLEQIRAKMTDRVIALEQEFFRQCVKKGVAPSWLEELNLGSTKQIAQLFEGFGMNLPRTKPSKSFPDGQPSVGDDALQSVKSARFRPMINALLELRSLKDKLLGTYVEPWLDLVKDPDNDNLLRTQFRFPGPITGRLSSYTPNLQNIPRPQEEGSDQGDPFKMRSAFIAPKGKVFGDADLSQIELRLMAHFSGDKAMIDALNNGWDLHSRTAIFCFSEVQALVKGRTLNKDLLKEVKSKFPTQRQNAKTLGFMIAYGGGPKRYADVSGHSMQEGQRVIDSFFRGYPGLKKSIDGVRAGCRKRGYVRTLLGRYIHVPDINHHMQGFRAAAERQCYNYVVQGSGSELIKMTMILCDQDPTLEEHETEMVLQIHDELCFYIPDESVKVVEPIINEYMSHPYRHFGMKDLKVPTPGELGYGKSWMEAKAA